MKRALVYALSLALLLSLAACNKPQAEQPDNSQPDNSAATSTQADVSTPEPDNTPEPEPPKAPVPEQLSDTTPAAPAENEDPQEQPAPATQEPAAQEPVSEPVKAEAPKQTTPKATTNNPPAETKQTEPEQKPGTNTGAVVPGVTVLSPDTAKKEHVVDEGKWAVGTDYSGGKVLTEEEESKIFDAAAEALKKSKQGQNPYKYDEELGIWYYE